MGKECDRFFSPPKRPQRKPNAIYTRTGAQYKAYKTICNITGSLTLILFMRQHVHSEPVDWPMRADHMRCSVGRVPRLSWFHRAQSIDACGGHGVGNGIPLQQCMQIPCVTVARMRHAASWAAHRHEQPYTGASEDRAPDAQEHDLLMLATAASRPPMDLHRAEEISTRPLTTKLLQHYQSGRSG